MTLELRPDVALVPEPGQVTAHGSGRLEPPTRPVPSRYLRFLPAPYQVPHREEPAAGADGTRYIDLGQFLLIFESILGPIERTVDHLGSYFDPRVAPQELLPWLAGWVGVDLDENWRIDRQRQLIVCAAFLYRWRGTRRGLRLHLQLYTGRAPLIIENFDGMRIGADAQLGINTRVGNLGARPHWLAITVFADDPAEVDERIVRQIIDFQKPAHIAYVLDIQTFGGSA